ncbi:hypothetical protein DUNSADRAFT_11961 [Dunaliella salina]|uniref:Uncharacterized protein n=1 Tax=Dunaliella salina TaxID=3046 RepID=A0ABQ7GC99_DUNSA|nr:hypothetical protein DUNSADRAFT_11961 [Dunaliella salina]|eukprot:KAF5832232.1 hypothetical protein DUNSADRAFT_11961 [Dunaliella salina]
MHRVLRVSGGKLQASRALQVRAFSAQTAQVSMPPPISQKKAAVLGGFCADSATYPLHWIYDISKVKELLSGKQDSPEFYPTPSCPFYNSGPVGVQSCYGDELIPLLKSMAENGGEFEATKYVEAMHEFYTKTSPNSYRNKSIRSFIAAYDEGKRGIACGDTTDSQANCFTKVPILVAKYAGRPECMAKVEEAIRVQQNNDQAVRHGLAAAKIMEKVMLGDSIDAALAWAKDTPGALEPEMQQLVSKAVEAAKNPPKELTFEPPAYMKPMMDKMVAEKDSLSPYTWAVWCHGPACGKCS